MIIVVPERGAEDGSFMFHGHMAARVNGDKGVVRAYHDAYLAATESDVIGYTHNDVEIYDENWYERVEREFADPKVAIVGLGGAMGIGTPDIYKTRYNIWQLQRVNYYSNQTDWRIHGQQETGTRDVAVVDGFFMAVRRKFLDEISGWQWFPFPFHCYDTCLCLMAHARGWKVRMVGCSCRHRGGETSTSADYKAWLESHGTTQARDHSEPHAWMYKEFRSILPLRVA